MRRSGARPTAKVLATYYHSYDDFNSDGVVNGSDYAQYAANFGHSLSPSGSFSGPMFSGRSLTQNGTGRILANLAPRDLYYSSQWQVLEERAMNADTGTLQVNDQNVWGQAYVDEMVLRDSRSLGNTTGYGNLGLTGSGLDSRIYVEQDANWNTTSLLDNAGNALEDIVYDPYGNVSVLNAGLASIAPEGFGWQYFHQGGRLDLTTGNYSFRHRDYSPTLGRWGEEEPSGPTYVDGLNLYLGESDNPIGRVDPSGELDWGWITKVTGGVVTVGGVVVGVVFLPKWWNNYSQEQHRCDVLKNFCTTLIASANPNRCSLNYCITNLPGCGFGAIADLAKATARGIPGTGITGPGGY